MPPAELTFAAALGDSQTTLACSCLLRLLAHKEPVVREGAIYGLQGHLRSPGVKERLARVAESDPREGVRLAAQDSLDPVL